METIKNSNESAPENTASDALAEMPKFDREKAAEVVAEAEANKNSKEAPKIDIESLEGRTDANREAYNKLAKRAAFLMSKFDTSDDSCPASISDELSGIALVQTMLMDGVYGLPSDRTFKEASYGDTDIVVTNWQSQKLPSTLEYLQTNQEKNAGLVDPAEEASFEWPKEKINTDDLMSKLESSKTWADAEAVQDEAKEYSKQNLDIDTMIKIMDLKNQASRKYGELISAGAEQEKAGYEARKNMLEQKLSKDFVVDEKEGVELVRQIMQANKDKTMASQRFESLERRMRKLEAEEDGMSFGKRLLTSFSRRRERRNIDQAINEASDQERQAATILRESIARAYGIDKNDKEGCAKQSENFFEKTDAVKLKRTNEIIAENH